MKDTNQLTDTLETRIREFNAVYDRIDQLIQAQEGATQPAAKLVLRLKTECVNLRDTLDRAQCELDQDIAADQYAA